MNLTKTGSAIPIVDSTTAIFERLRELKAECGPEATRHDQAVVLIDACIAEGMDTGPRITGALKRLGLNKQHVGMILSEGTGSNPQRHRWFKDDEGRYRSHEEPPVAR